MNRLALGVIFGIAFGIVDVLMVLREDHPMEVLCQAFFSRFALGVLATTVDWRVNPILTGAVVGLLISLPRGLRAEVLRRNSRNRPRIWRYRWMGRPSMGEVAPANGPA
jgi:hypothetical protein